MIGDRSYEPSHGLPVSLDVRAVDSFFNQTTANCSRRSVTGAEHTRQNTNRDRGFKSCQEGTRWRCCLEVSSAAAAKDTHETVMDADACYSADGAVWLR